MLSAEAIVWKKINRIVLRWIKRNMIIYGRFTIHVFINWIGCDIGMQFKFKITNFVYWREKLNSNVQHALSFFLMFRFFDSFHPLHSITMFCQLSSFFYRKLQQFFCLAYLIALSYSKPHESQFVFICLRIVEIRLHSL